MKILYIQDRLSFGGVNRVTSYKENYWVNKGHKVYNLCMDYAPNETSPYKYDERIKFYNLDQSDYNKLLRIPFLGRLLRFVFFRIAFLKILIEINPDIIITVRDYIEPFTVIFFTFWKKRILEFHGCLQNIQMKQPFSLRLFLRHRIKYRFYTLVTLTQADKKKRENFLRLPFYVINNPIVDIKTGRSTCEEKKIICLGRFSEEKGYDILIQRWKSISSSFPEWSLHLYGKGELESLYNDLIKNNKLENSVFIHPPVENVYQTLIDASIYVMTSHYEAFPLVLTEAMQCGVPCVSMDCHAGPREIITHGVDGYLADTYDEFVEMLSCLIKDEDKRKKFGERAYYNIQRFSLNRTMSQWEKLFFEINLKS